MPRRSYGGGEAIAIANDNIFQNNTARDVYFTANPTKLKQQIYIQVGTLLQRRVDSNWVDYTAYVKGTKGDKGDKSTDAETAERLKTPRKINGIDFDGTKNITINGGSGEETDHEKLDNLQGGAKYYD